MQMIRFALGIRFEMPDLTDVPQNARQFWEEIFSVLTAADVAGLHVYGGLLEKGPYGLTDASYLCVFMGGGLKQMRRIFRKLDNDAGIAMYLCASHPYLQNNALVHIEGLDYLGRVHRGELTGGDVVLEGTRIYMRHGKRRPVGKGIRFLLAPEAFGTMDAAAVAKRLTIAARRQFSGVRILPLPMAYGGAGTVDALLSACDSVVRSVAVTGQYGGRVQARYGVLRGAMAIIEAVSVKESPGEGVDPLSGTSYGIGEQIRRALDEGLEQICIGVGAYFAGDCGLGCIRALGAKLLDAQGCEITNAAELGRVCKLDTELLHPRIRNAAFTMLYDGAAVFDADTLRVQAQDCGADAARAKAFAQDAASFLHVLEDAFGAGIGALPGAGAAGGLGAMLLSALDAAFTPGVGPLLDAARFGRHMREFSLVVTGAGVLRAADVQPGRPLYELVKRCEKHHVPIVALAGSLPDGAQPLLEQGVGSVLALDGEDAASKDVQERLDDAAERLFRLIRIGRQIERVSAVSRKQG